MRHTKHVIVKQHLDSSFRKEQGLCNDYLNVGNVKFKMSAKEGGCLSGSWEFGQETGEIGYIGVVVLHVT